MRENIKKFQTKNSSNHPETKNLTKEKKKFFTCCDHTLYFVHTPGIKFTIFLVKKSHKNHFNILNYSKYT